MSSDEPDKAGYIYVLVNSAMPDLVKIGLTRGTTKARAEDLSRGTGIPTPFVVVYDELVADCRATEKRLHEDFSYCRENVRREFFRVAPKKVIDALQALSRNSTLLDEEPVRINILPAFDARCRRWLRRDLIGLSYLQTSTLCILETIIQQSYKLADTEVTRTVLDFIRDDDGSTFSPKLDPQENARKMVSMDSYSLINCFNIIDPEVAKWIDEQHRYHDYAPFSSQLPRPHWHRA